VVRVGCFQPFGPLFMTALLRRYLEAIGPTDLVLMEGDQRQLSAWLSNGEIDFVVTYATGQVFADATPICSVPPHAVLHRDDPLANLPAVAPAELAARPFVLLDLPETAPFLTAVFDRRTPPRIAFRSQNYETVRSAVAVGLGVSVLNLRPFGEAALDPPTLVRRPLEGAPEPLTLVVADIYQGLKPHFVSVFIEETRRFFEEAGPERYAVA
jgi:DNA-binding transcriptional LysR family regulator